MTTYDFSHKRGDTFRGKEFQLSTYTAVSTYSELPATGTAGVIYKTLDTLLTYEWDTTAYVATTNKVYIDLTGCTLLCQLRVAPLTTVAYTMAMTILDAATGRISMDSQIIDIPGKVYKYDVQITFPTGDIQTYIQGTCTIIDDISRPV